MIIDPTVTTVLQLAGGGGVGALSAWLVFRAKSKDDKQTLIDQLQEERNHVTEQRRLDRDEFKQELIEERKTYVEQLDKEREKHDQRTARLLLERDEDHEYITDLQLHIAAGSPPPPPERRRRQNFQELPHV